MSKLTILAVNPVPSPADGVLKISSKKEKHEEEEEAIDKEGMRERRRRQRGERNMNKNIDEMILSISDG